MKHKETGHALSSGFKARRNCRGLTILLATERNEDHSE